MSDNIYKNKELAEELNSIKNKVYTDQGLNPPKPGGPTPDIEMDATSNNVFDLHNSNLKHLSRLADPNLRLPLTSHRHSIGQAIVFTKKAMRRALKPISSTLLNTQHKFNVMMVESLAPIGTWIQETRDQLEELGIKHSYAHEELKALSGKVDNFEHSFQQFVSETYQTFERIDKSRDNTTQSLQKEIYDINNSLEAQVKHATELFNNKITEINAKLGTCLGEQNYIRDLVSELKDKPVVAGTPTQAVPEAETKSLRAGESNDTIYYEFENIYRGSQEDITKRQEAYLDIFKNQQNVLDIGCGRGEFLELLKNNGVSCQGVDSNRRMVKECTDKGLEVAHGNAFYFLAELEDNSLGGIFSAQVIEHIPSELLPKFIRLCYRKLAPGAPFVAETVNAQSVVTAATNFYIDITHHNPVHPESVKFLAMVTGFKDVDLMFSAPYPQEATLQEIPIEGIADEAMKKAFEVMNNNNKRLNDVLFGYQDYAVIGYK